MSVSKETLLLYGNCQAAALAHIFSSDPTVTAAYDVRYYPSFDDRAPGSKELTAGVVASIGLFIKQFDPVPFPYANLIPSAVPTLTFPSIDLHLLWPLSVQNVYNDQPTPDRPWGRFPMGDRVILDCVERGLGVADTLAYYERSSISHLPELNRYAAMERARLQMRETKCDVAMSDYVFERFWRENLFWTFNHPTMGLLRELTHRLLSVASDRGYPLPGATLDRTLDTLGSDGPLAFLRVPIHPHIVEHFGMDWYRHESGRDFGLRMQAPTTTDEYFRDMTQSAIDIRDARQSVRVSHGD